MREMYTGTLIKDLMTTVERAVQRAEQRNELQRIADEELRAIYAMQIPVTENDRLFNDQVFMGAA
jgi:hypothetical protein